MTEIGPFFIKKTVHNRILKYLENDGHGDGEVVSLLALYWTNEFEYDWSLQIFYKFVAEKKGLL